MEASCTILAKRHEYTSIYRSEAVMAVPLHSYCDDTTMHVDWVVYFISLAGAPYSK